MLTMGKPIAVACSREICTLPDILSEKILSAYQIMWLQAAPEEFLHLVTGTQDYGEAADRAQLAIYHSADYEQIYVQVLNQFFNQVLCYGNSLFTYADQVYLGIVLRKLGLNPNIFWRQLWENQQQEYTSNPPYYLHKYIYQKLHTAQITEQMKQLHYRDHKANEISRTKVEDWKNFHNQENIQHRDQGENENIDDNDQNLLLSFPKEPLSGDQAQIVFDELNKLQREHHFEQISVEQWKKIQQAQEEQTGEEQQPQSQKLFLNHMEEVGSSVRLEELEEEESKILLRQKEQQEFAERAPILLSHREQQESLEQSLSHREQQDFLEKLLRHREQQEFLEQSLSHREQQKSLEQSLSHREQQKSLEQLLRHREQQEFLEKSVGKEEGQGKSAVYEELQKLSRGIKQQKNQEKENINIRQIEQIPETLGADQHPEQRKNAEPPGRIETCYQKEESGKTTESERLLLRQTEELESTLRLEKEAASGLLDQKEKQGFSENISQSEKERAPILLSHREQQESLEQSLRHREQQESLKKLLSHREQQESLEQSLRHKEQQDSLEQLLSHREQQESLEQSVGKEEGQGKSAAYEELQELSKGIKRQKNQEKEKINTRQIEQIPEALGADQHAEQRKNAEPPGRSENQNRKEESGKTTESERLLLRQTEELESTLRLEKEAASSLLDQKEKQRFSENFSQSEKERAPILLRHREQQDSLEQSLRHREQQESLEQSLRHREQQDSLEQSLRHREQQDSLEQSLSHREQQKSLEQLLRHREQQEFLEKSVEREEGQGKSAVYEKLKQFSRGIKQQKNQEKEKINIRQIEQIQEIFESDQHPEQRKNMESSGRIEIRYQKEESGKTTENERLLLRQTEEQESSLKLEKEAASGLLDQKEKREFTENLSQSEKERAPILLRHREQQEFLEQSLRHREQQDSLEQSLRHREQQDSLEQSLRHREQQDSLEQLLSHREQQDSLEQSVGKEEGQGKSAAYEELQELSRGIKQQKNQEKEKINIRQIGQIPETLFGQKEQQEIQIEGWKTFLKLTQSRKPQQKFRERRQLELIYKNPKLAEAFALDDRQKEPLEVKEIKENANHLHREQIQLRQSNQQTQEILQQETKQRFVQQQQEALRKEADKLQQLLIQNLHSQINQITDKVYGKLERRLQNERRRRGW